MELPKFSMYPTEAKERPNANANASADVLGLGRIFESPGGVSISQPGKDRLHHEERACSITTGKCW